MHLLRRTTVVLVLTLSCLGCAARTNTLKVVLNEPPLQASYTFQGEIPSDGLHLVVGRDFSAATVYDPAFYDPASAGSHFAQYTSSAYRSEADLYVEDPRDIVRFWEADAYSSETLDRVRNVKISPPYIIANAPQVPLVAPPSPTLQQSFIIAKGFHPWYTTPGPSALLQAQHVFLYNYGRCATEVRLEDILKPMADELLKGIFDNVRGRSVTVEVTSYLDYGDTRDQPIAGFLLYVSGRTPTRTGLADVTFEFSRRYSFRLASGVLEVVLDRSQDDLSRFHCVGGDHVPFCSTLTSSVRDTILRGIDQRGGLADSLNLMFLSAQSIELAPPDTDPTSKQCPGDFSCPDPLSNFNMGVAVIAGTDKLAAIFSLDAAAKRRLLTDVQSQAASSFNWACAPRVDVPTRNRCIFILRAAELNAFPNALQLVWLTDNLVHGNSGAAGTAATYGGPRAGTDVPSRLCTAQHKTRIEHGTDRQFVHVEVSDSL